MKAKAKPDRPEEGSGLAQDVLLAFLPLSSARYPSLALGLLKAAVAAAGRRCDARYFSLDYLERIGAGASACLSDLRYYTALAGEWVFAGAAHAEAGAPEDDDEATWRYLTEVFVPKCPQRELAARMAALLEARQGAAAFIEHCVASVDWRRYGVLGVSTSFQQNMASLAFARRVKARFPHVLVVFGGANCQGEMGVELHRRYRFIDAVCLGEGDRTFPELIRRHFANEDLSGIAGFITRGADGTSRLPARAVDQVENLDTLPYPDFSDFYGQRRRSAVASRTRPVLMFETARGCWWGAKHHCTFCGLNGRMMSYRSKSQPRAHEELRHLWRAHGGADVVTADAILNLEYFGELLPRLAAEGPPARLFWQMKANLRPEHIALLWRAGVRRIQPGIEALDSELLGLMRKGCTMLQNVQLLKLAAEAGLSVAWNLLYGFPGEDRESYLRSARLMPKLRHLQPPMTTGRALADRFSPYFQNPDDFGVTLHPAPAYRFIYPFGPDAVRGLAYHFHMRSAALAGIEQAVAPMRAEQLAWCAHWRESALYAEDEGEAVIVTDERWGWPRARHCFEQAEAAVLRLCWRNTGRGAIERELGGRFSERDLSRAIGALEELGLLIGERGEHLAVPLRQPGWRRAPTWREVVLDNVIPYAALAGR